MRLAGMVLCGALLAGCAMVEKDYSDNPRYSFMVGKTFQTKDDNLLYHYKNDRKKKIDLSPFGDFQGVPKREQMQPTFPFRFYNIIVIGVLPVGSEFQITKVKYHANSSSWIAYYATITSSPDAKWVGTEINVTWLADRPRGDLEGPPVFDPGLVMEVGAVLK